MQYRNPGCGDVTYCDVTYCWTLSNWRLVKEVKVFLWTLFSCEIKIVLYLHNHSLVIPKSPLSNGFLKVV